MLLPSPPPLPTALLPQSPPGAPKLLPPPPFLPPLPPSARMLASSAVSRTQGYHAAVVLLRPRCKVRQSAPSCNPGLRLKQLSVSETSRAGMYCRRPWPSPSASPAESCTAAAPQPAPRRCRRGLRSTGLHKGFGCRAAQYGSGIWTTPQQGYGIVLRCYDRTWRAGKEAAQVHLLFVARKVCCPVSNAVAWKTTER